MTLDLPAVTAALTRAATVPDDDWHALAAAVRAEADIRAIGDLTSLYARAVDDHDLDTLVAMFTPEGVFEVRGHRAAGAEQLRTAYVESFGTYRTMLHTPHPGVVQLHGNGTASGWSSGHAELATRRTLVLAAFRYEDDYRRLDGRWLFARRSVTFMYAVPVDQLSGSFGTVERIRWPGTSPAAADYPESTATWDRHRR